MFAPERTTAPGPDLTTVKAPVPLLTMLAETTRPALFVLYCCRNSEPAVLTTPAVKALPVPAPATVTALLPVTSRPPLTIVCVKPVPIVKVVAAAGATRTALADWLAVVVRLAVSE